MENNSGIAVNGSQRIGYIDALRGFTMFLVVLMHVATVCWGIVGKGISIHDYLHQVRMPLFFFISGFVLYKEGVEWNTQHIVRFFKKKIPVQLLGPFIFFAVFLHLNGISLAEGLLDKYKSGYWFTLVLLEFFFIYAAVRFCVRNRWYKAILLVIGCVLYYCCWPDMTTGHHTLDNLCLLLSVNQWRFFIFFVIGTSFTGLVIVFAFFHNKQDLFSQTTRMGRTMQYVGRRTLDIYLIHFFLIPKNLSFITVFTDHPMPIIEATVSSLIALLIMAASLLISNIIRLSPWLARWLFGAKKA